MKMTELSSEFDPQLVGAIGADLFARTLAEKPSQTAAGVK